MKNKKQTREETIHWKFSNQECYQIASAFRRLNNTHKVAELFHVSHLSIREVLDAMEVPRRRRNVRGSLTIDEKQIAAYLADKKGRSGRYIARQLHRSPSFVLRFLHANGSRVRLPRNYMLSDIQKAMIKPMYDKGYSTRVIGMYLGVHYSTVSYQMKKLGIARRNPGSRRRVYPAMIPRMCYLREHKGYTYKRIAKEFGISESNVWTYLNSKT
jgi:predicted transcriptional regulator